MKKTNATDTIKALGKNYTDTVSKIKAVRTSKDYSDEYKQAVIDQIEREYTNTCDHYKSKASDAVKALQSGLVAKRQADIEKGLASAETVNSIVSGIRNGIYQKEMLNDLVDIHADNAYAIKAIRGALLASDNDSYRSVGLEIPVSNDDRIARNLDNIIKGINEMPSPLATENGQGNFNIGFYQSGQNFDSWCEYIDINISDND